MSIQEEIQSLSPSAIVEMFILDSTAMSNGTLFRFHPGVSEVKSALTWQGHTYQPLPVEVDGFDVTAGGSLPRPKIRVANAEGLFSALVAEMDDLIGCKVIRKRTMARYLDAVNFKSGNPFADPMQEFPDDLWFIDRKVSENKYMIEWELASAFDLQGVMLPFRQLIQNSCCWSYRGSECGYRGAPFNRFDQKSQPGGEDFCAKRLSSCQARFNDLALSTLTPDKQVILPFGGFPGVLRDF